MITSGSGDAQLLERLEDLGREEVHLVRQNRVLDLVPLVKERQEVLDELTKRAGGRELSEYFGPAEAARIARILARSREALAQLASQREDCAHSIVSLRERKKAATSYALSSPLRRGRPRPAGSA